MTPAAADQDTQFGQTRHWLEPRDYPRLLSLVIPIYNEQEALPFLRERLTAFLNTLPCAAEVLLVNDGSRDASLDQLVRWSRQDARIKVFNLARNFGHQIAVTAGLDYANGDAVVVMDADLQDPPEVIRLMLDEYRRGFDVVYGQRSSRKGETAFKKLTAWAFYRVMRVMVHKDLPVDTGDFRLVSRACLDAVRAMRETHRFLRGMIAWVGFPQTAVRYERDSRVAGETKYPFHKMLRLAWTAAVSFSPLPLRASFWLGFSIALIGMAEAANAVIRTLLGLYVVPGWTSLLVVTCLIGGSILISIGVLGEYVGRIFEASKERPLYLVASQFGVAKERETPAPPRPKIADDEDLVPKHLALLAEAHHD